MMRKAAAFLGVISLLAIIAILLAACGGGDDEEAAAPTTQQTTTARLTPEATSPAATSEATPKPTTTTGTAEPGGGSAAASGACALVTKEDAAAALGEDVNDPESTTVGSQEIAPGLTVEISACDYSSATTAHYVALSAWQAAGDSADDVRKAIDQVVCQGKERLSDLGDVAYWYDSDHTELQVLKGAAFLDLNIAGDDNVDTTEALKTLAEAALDRLP